MNEVEKLQADLSAKSAEVVKLEEVNAGLEAKVSELEPLAEIGKVLQARTVDEIKRLAACVGDTIVPAIVDTINDVSKLIEIQETLSAKWAEKRGVTSSAEGEHAAGQQPESKLTPKELSICKQLGISEAEYLAAKEAK